jgi:glycosyltransferase involved in cell wall biosynthesis
VLVKIPGVELRVLTTDSDGPARIRVESFPARLPAGYDVYYCRRWIGADIAPGLFRRLYAMIKWADVVHLTAVYSPPTIPVLFFCYAMGRPVVWSTRGALQRWEGSTRTRIKSAWERLCNSLCKSGQVVLHVTSDEERLESVKRIPNAQPAVIPNGIELPKLNGVQGERKDNELRILYLGRLHPIKGIENLLRALPVLKANARLSICGDGDSGYQKQLHSLAHELGLNGRVRFQGRVDGQAKEQQFREADLCVVPSFTENFSIVVAEALAHGVPVVASRGTPWQRLVEMGCGLWVDNSSEELSKAMDLAANLPLREMGRRGREWMGREYSWQTVAEQMAAQYRLLIEANQSGR